MTPTAAVSCRPDTVPPFDRAPPEVYRAAVGAQVAMSASRTHASAWRIRPSARTTMRARESSAGRTPSPSASTSPVARRGRLPRPRRTLAGLPRHTYNRPILSRTRHNRGGHMADLPTPADRIIWEPYGDYLDASNVRRFMDAHGIATYEDLIRRSTDDVEWFWAAALQDLGVVWDEPYSAVLDESRGFPWARWFVDGKLNIVRNCIDRHAAGPRAGRAALEWVTEGGERAHGELRGARPRGLSRRQRHERRRTAPRRRRRSVHAHDPRARRGVLRGAQDRRHRDPRVLGLRCPGPVDAPGGRRRPRPVHRRRLGAARQAYRHQAGGGPRRRPLPRPRAHRRRRPPGRGAARRGGPRRAR